MAEAVLGAPCRAGTETSSRRPRSNASRSSGYSYDHGSRAGASRRRSCSSTSCGRTYRTRYPDLPDGCPGAGGRRFTRPEGVDTLRRNMASTGPLPAASTLEIERPTARVEHRHIYADRLGHPERNDFLVVNQLPIRGRNDRRPDIVVFVNGLPLVVFELKNPWDRRAHRRRGAQPDRSTTRNDIAAALRLQRASASSPTASHPARHVDGAAGVVRAVEVDRRHRGRGERRPAA